MNQRKISNWILILTFAFTILIFSLLSLNSANAQTSSVNIYSDSKIISLCNFNITDYTLYFNNAGDSAQVVQIIPKGSGAEFITLSNDLLLLKPHEKETVKVFLNPNNKIGTYKTTLEFVINNKEIKELTQTYIFKTCETFNASVEPFVKTCYKNKTGVNLNVKNERNEILNLIIKYQNKEYSLTVAPLDSVNTTVYGDYKKIGNFTDKIILEDEATKYSTTKHFNVEVNPCGAKFFSLSAFISSSLRKFLQFIIRWWKWILLIIILIILLILVILAIKRYKHKKEEAEIIRKGKEKIEPVLDVIQGETDIKEVEKAKEPEEKKTEETEKEERAEETKEAGFVVNKKEDEEGEKEKELRKEEEEKIKPSEVLAKEPYYKRVIKKITFNSGNSNHKTNWWKILLVIFVILALFLLVVFVIFAHHTVKFKILNSSVNPTQQTQVNITNTTQSANTTSKSQFSLSFIHLKPFFKGVWSFILLYKGYFLIGVIISILLILYCNQKGYPCKGEKIRRVKETKDSTARKTKKTRTRRTKKASGKKRKRKPKETE